MSNVDQVNTRPTSIVHACPNSDHTIVALRTDIPDPGLNREFQALLLSNDPPVQAVADIARRQYEEAKKYFAIIDAQTMQARTARLSEERDKIGQYLEKYKTILHPLRRLPVEILTNIFWLSTAVNLSLHPNLIFQDGVSLRLHPNLIFQCGGKLYDTTKTPRVLSQVCRLWRSAAMSFPLLWSQICIKLVPVDRNTVARVTSQFLFLVFQIQRSLHCPLTLDIFSYSEPHDHPFLAILLPTSPRWKALRVTMSPEGLEALSSVRGSLESLQTLHMDIVPSKELGDTDSIDVFESAPALQNLILTGDAHIAHISIKLPWSQIRRFSWDEARHAASFGTSVYLEIFTLMPNLRYCFIKGSLNTKLHSQITQIPLLSLEELTIITTHPTYYMVPVLTRFLDAICVPSLQKFQIPTGINQGDLTGLVNFVSRRPLALHSINFQNLPFKSSEITHLLSCLPLSVTTLILGMADGVDAEVVRAFHYSPASDSLPLLPKLKYLGLICENKCDDDILIDMIESRYRTSLEALRLGLSRLESFSVPKDSGYDTLVSNPRIAQLRSEGLKIECLVRSPLST